jgi:hypothetical protein
MSHRMVLALDALAVAWGSVLTVLGRQDTRADRRQNPKPAARHRAPRGESR